MKRKLNILFLALTLAVLLSGCKEKSQNPMADEQISDSNSVNLTVWGAEEDEQLLRQMIDEFQEEYKEQLITKKI